MRNPATKKYTEADILALSGKIRASTYCTEVREALAKRKIVKSDNYISQVVNGFIYNEQVWDAVVDVLNTRKVERQVRSALVAQAIAD